ncbi:hypothetical protein JMA_26570 [Jeotgalibacillus malaysiensis]|uniref:Uncharacterized protein n=1 Tax=Jeotgalibacillus malaysiensis TaxID=1508404 RepID=A0A0B5AVE9_9BACL|nr:hypothetical protein JMA_26570 [Jeotgalibacillus malaysiensis]
MNPSWNVHSLILQCLILFIERSACGWLVIVQAWWWVRRKVRVVLRTEADVLRIDNVVHRKNRVVRRKNDDLLRKVPKDLLPSSFLTSQKKPPGIYPDGLVLLFK